MTSGTERLDVSKFYKYDELVGILNGWVDSYPELASLESIGKSYEGRDIWLLTVTSQKGGTPDEKPALYIDANIHAGEVTGSSVLLWTVDELLRGYGNDSTITTLLDTRTFYFAPRVQPDGVELYLTSPTMLRSSVRPWPFEESGEGLQAEDINGDGKILQMRIEDPNGEWKVSDKDPRLIIKREPDELEGTFYRIYVEGMIKDPDGGPLKIGRTKYGLDQNRNWPENWSMLQRGAGPHPLSEPETRAVATFITTHPNITVVQNYHTAGGVVLRPPCAVDDAVIPPRDLDIYNEFGKIGEAVTGYPCASVYDAFPLRDDEGRRSQSGGFIEWTYGHYGIWSFATELWDLQSRAGIEKPANDAMRVAREMTEEDGLKILAFVDSELNGEGIIPWEPFDHPQLGKVEIGGWDGKYLRQNAPAKFLTDEAERNGKFTIRQAAMTPLLGLENVSAEQVADGLSIVRATVVNQGYLPTHLSWMARKNRAVKPIEIEVEGGEVLMGKRKQEIGHLAGRISMRGFGAMSGMMKTDNERQVEWLVRGTGSVTIHARSEKGGTVRQEVQLG